MGAVGEGLSGADAMKNIIETAQKAEEWGYHRVWLAEHHNTRNFISRAPEVTIPLVASNTSGIRVGSGSVLLNHYSPFKVAEVFTLLADMFPGRIDMGIGRATTGPISDFALQRNRSVHQRTDDSEEQLTELLNWLNYVFAGFINPEQAYDMAWRYRDNFIPGMHGLAGTKPRLILSLSIYCADTLEDAGKLAAPMLVMMQRMRVGDVTSTLPNEEQAVELLGGVPTRSELFDPRIPPRYLIGTPALIEQDLIQIAAAFEIDEVMIQCISNQKEHRLRCLELVAQALA